MRENGEFGGWNYFYPRPPRGGRRHSRNERPRCAGISIHALREEGDPRAYESGSRGQEISIHALREEGDDQEGGFLMATKKFLSTPSARRATLCADCPADRDPDFYPRPPRGGRPPTACFSWPHLQFLSTPSARRATPLAHRAQPNPAFLSTPSARRATVDPESTDREDENFYPRPPRGGRPGGMPRPLRSPSSRRAWID